MTIAQYRSALQAALAIIGFCAMLPANAQRISGTLIPHKELPGKVVLQEAWGGSHRSVDSTTVDRKGKFQFPAKQRGPGFYRLAFGPTETVDLIIDPRETEIVLQFADTPLQEHIMVQRSTGNQRLWEYKRASREGQIKLSSIQEERRGLSLNDREAQAQLDAREEAVHVWQKAVLDRLIAVDPSGSFERIILADRRLSDAAGKGPDAVKEAIDWTDQALVRSSVMPKALMGYLQELPEATTEDFSNSSDSLLIWSQPDTLCWAFARSFLVRLFSIYGPDVVAQHLVDRYVVGSGSLVPADQELRGATEALLRVSIGATAPSVFLVDPVEQDTLELAVLLKDQAYTLLFFYSSTCDHCHQQMPGLIDLYREKREKGFEILGIALDIDLQEFQSTLKDRGLIWPSFSELNGWGSSPAKAFAVRSTPSLFLLDRNGVIVAKPYDHQELRTTLEGLFTR